MKVDNSSESYNDSIGNPPSDKNFSNVELVESLLRVVSLNDYLKREVQKLWNAVDTKQQKEVVEYIQKRWDNTKDLDNFETFVSILSLSKLLEISEQEIRDNLNK